MVRHEDWDYLQMGRKSKMDKCAPLLLNLKDNYNMKEGGVLLVVTGIRRSASQAQN
jgi:hypothetical protein